MKALTDYSLQDLKQVYQILHQKLPEEPALMDNVLLDDLQSYLQQQAKKDGVDVSLHADWASWLAR